MTKTAPEGTTCICYVRLSREDAKSMSIENQTAKLAAYAPGSKLVIDRGVSGETNLTDPKSNWSKEVRPFLEAHPGAQVVLFTLDRMGRKKGAMFYEAEQIIDAGGSIYTVRDDRLFDDMEDAGQAISMMMGSYEAHAYRVESAKKTQVALDVLAENEIPVGRKPDLTEDDLARIRALREKGLGYTAIGKALGVKRLRDGKQIEVARSPRLIKRALSGEYETREAYERRSREKREAMLARAVLGIRVGEEVG
jgi:hypothetical protein